MSDRVPHPSLGEAIAGLVVLPPLAYAFGFLMWVGPSRALYGQNVALALPASTLLFAGVIYLSTVGLAILFGAMLGAERLWWPKGHMARGTLLGAEVAFWLIGIFLANAFARGVAFGSPGSLTWTTVAEPAYLVVHVIVLALAFRRLYGLVRGRWAAPDPQRRPQTPNIRLLQAVAVLVIVVMQVPLALLFGVLGPNPAKNIWPVTIINGGARQPMYLLHQNDKWVLGVDSLSRSLVRLPLDDRDVIVFGPHNPRLQRSVAGRR